jgi:hypothetical protein
MESAALSRVQDGEGLLEHAGISNSYGGQP